MNSASKHRRNIFFAAAVSSLCGSASGLTLSQEIVNPANGHKYVLLDASDWSTAQTEAVSLGGTLAIINDASEQSWVYSTFSTFASQKRNLWIGLYDPDPIVNSINTETRRTEFRWVDGSQVSFTAWAGIEPNNPSLPEFFVHIWNPNDPHAGKWNNLVNSDSVFGIPVNGVVEISAVPEPQSFLLMALGFATILTFRRKAAIE